MGPLPRPPDEALRPVVVLVRVDPPAEGLGSAEGELHVVLVARLRDWGEGRKCRTSLNFFQDVSTHPTYRRCSPPPWSPSGSSRACRPPQSRPGCRCRGRASRGQTARSSRWPTGSSRSWRWGGVGLSRQYKQSKLDVKVVKAHM